ncbi:MAG: tRNA (guanosine(46)-N7)-methyltransferase TrmB [Myxococcota bacterium]
MGLRKHCNPLTFREKVEPPDWGKAFPVERPMEIDVGCGKGDFVFERARNHPEINFVGLDVREAFCDILSKRLKNFEGDNLYILRCNVNVSLKELFRLETVAKIHIYFPDPWFKKRHKKRRIVTSEFVETCAEILVLGGELHIASDVEKLAREILGICEGNQRLKNIAERGFAKERFFPETTNWEKHLLKISKPFWRIAFEKKIQETAEIEL